MKLSTLILAAFLTPTIATAATIGCPAGSRAFLELVAVATDELVPDVGDRSGAALLCTGGAATRVDVDAGTLSLPAGGPTAALLPASVVVVTGTVPRAERAALNAALVAAEVGRIGSCRLAAPGTLAFAQRITWHGRQGRRNTFTLATDGSDPACSGEVEVLFAAIQQALLAAGSAPDAQAVVID